MYQLQTLRDVVRIEINIYLARKNVNVQLRSLQTVKNVHMMLNFKKKLKKNLLVNLNLNYKKKNIRIIDKPYCVAQDYLYDKEAFNYIIKCRFI